MPSAWERDGYPILITNGGWARWHSWQVVMLEGERRRLVTRGHLCVARLAGHHASESCLKFERGIHRAVIFDFAISGSGPAAAVSVWHSLQVLLQSKSSVSSTRNPTHSRASRAIRPGLVFPESADRIAPLREPLRDACNVLRKAFSQEMRAQPQVCREEPALPRSALSKSSKWHPAQFSTIWEVHCRRRRARIALPPCRGLNWQVATALPR